jgi:hypothetical protein
MTRTIATWLATAAAVGTLVGMSPAIAQTKSGCDAAKTPSNVEGQVVKVDASQNTVTVRGSDGTTHELQVSKAAIKDFKVGDRIEANLRSAPRC